MIEYASGDILKSGTDALVNTINCVGVMGRGIALQFRHAYPENFRAYAAACRRGEVQPGRMFVFETGQLAAPRYIINFPTKRHWRGKSRIEDIEAGLAALVEVIRARRIRSIAIPPLGSGLGGLDWIEVRPRIKAALAGLADVRVLILEPSGAPTSDAMAHSREVPRMTAGRAALVELMHRYLGGLLDPFVTLLEVHKLMYFYRHQREGPRIADRAAHDRHRRPGRRARTPLPSRARPTAAPATSPAARRTTTAPTRSTCRSSSPSCAPRSPRPSRSWRWPMRTTPRTSTA
jgi:O-acetyl-ADP-ribose deacetylase (regulator of RNase III)